MKTLMYAAVSLLLLGSCSKERVEPTGLNDTKWRLTSQTREEYLKGSPQKRIENLYKDCLGKNIITFTSSGQVLWTQDAGGCSPYDHITEIDRIRRDTWGQWQLKESPRQLLVIMKDKQLRGIFPEYSALPVLIGVQGSYDIPELNSTTLTLSKTYTIPTQANPTQDSVYVFLDTFTRVAE